MCIKNFSYTKGGLTMRTWKKPIVVEIAVGMEINCYVCAEL
jgi:coenzyme PQQ precursor peptide PqqA